MGFAVGDRVAYRDLYKQKGTIARRETLNATCPAGRAVELPIYVVRMDREGLTLRVPVARMAGMFEGEGK